MVIKGALFDIDDTLYSHSTQSVPSLTLKALDKLKEKGIKIGVCTSRVAAEMENIPDELLSRFDCQIMSTGAVSMVKGKYYKAYVIDKEDIRKYTTYFRNNNISYHYSDVAGNIYYWGDLNLVSEGKALRMAKNKVMFKEYEAEDEVTNLFFYNKDELRAEEIKNINPDQYISWWGSSGNIGPRLVDKSFGLMKFCQLFGFTTDEVIAFGDGGNDDVMLQMAGIGVAIKDGKSNTLDAADYICKKSIDDGGIYEALIDLKIIEEDQYDPKIFFFDIDNTLFCHTNEMIYDSVYDSLQKLKEKGYKLCAITSRSLDEMYNAPKKLLDYFDDIEMLAGAYSKDEVFLIEQNTAENIISYLDENNLTYRYCTSEGKGYLNRMDDKAQLFKKLYDMIPPLKNYEKERLTNILFYADKQLATEIFNIFGSVNCSYLRYGGELSPKGIDKGTTLVRICQKYGFTYEDACAFGDGGNDISMLLVAKLGIAMGNASLICKQSADYITDATYEDGIYNALKHFNFI